MPRPVQMVPTEVAGRLAELVRQRGLSQQALAYTAGVAQSSVSQLLGGRRPNPSAEFAARVARALGLTPQQYGELVYGCLPPPPPPAIKYQDSD